MYCIDGSCRKSDILSKMLHQFGWSARTVPGKGPKVVRFTKAFGSPQSAAEARSILHRRLIQHDIRATFGMTYFNKDATL